MLEVYKSLPEGTLCQLINNQIIISPSPLDIHQKILGKIFVALVNLVESNKSGEVRIAPYDIYELFGVKEYWLVDCCSKFVQGFILENNEFKALPFATATITSLVLKATFSF